MSVTLSILPLMDPFHARGFRLHRAPPWRLRVSPGDLQVLVSGGKSHVPKDGWNSESFRLHGATLILTLQKIALLTRRKAEPEVRQRMRRIIQTQADLTIARVARISGRAIESLARKNVFDLAPKTPDLPSNSVSVSLVAEEGIWDEALRRVFEETTEEAVKEMLPPLQSVAAQGYSIANRLLGQADVAATHRHLAGVTHDIADRVVRINETTRRKIAHEIRDSLDRGLGIRETAENLRDKVTELSDARLNCIARTELNNAWTQGSLQSFRESPTILAISVIGCSAQEPGWTWHGEPTCNIQDVPIESAHELVWHPNHQGTVVPSIFRSPHQ